MVKVMKFKLKGTDRIIYYEIEKNPSRFLTFPFTQDNHAAKYIINPIFKNSTG